MTRPFSKPLNTLGWIAALSLSIGLGSWIAAFISFRVGGGNYELSNRAARSSVEWMEFGGTLAGFGLIALVGYLVAAAIADFLLPLQNQKSER